jgi:16S rRNA (cytosine1402-N4)-methyltransferase
MIEHIPVMLDEVLKAVTNAPSLRRIVDATLGLGGYTKAFLKQWPHVSVLGIDRDSEAIEIAKDKLAEFLDRVKFYNGDFKDLAEILKKIGFTEPDAIVFDLGVSNLQISKEERGFSFDLDGPLDMRMDTTSDLTAEEVINTYSKEALSEIFRKYGEERHASRIAWGICKYRQEHGLIRTTGELVSVIRMTLPAPVQRKMGKNPARRVFQALRIGVNNELKALEEALSGCREVAKEGTVVVVVSYHSLEDKIVKKQFKEWESLGLGRMLSKKVVKPTEEEITRNKKARSAKLRSFIFGERELKG